MAHIRDEPAARRTLVAVRLFFVGVGLGAMVLGYFGLEHYVAGLPSAESRRSESGVSNTLYYDLELFLVQSTPLAAGGRVPWALQAARFAAPSVLVYAFVELWAALFTRRLGRRRLRGCKDHAIVCGSNRAARALAGRLRAAGTTVVVVTTEEPTTAERDTLVADPRSPAALLAAGAARAASLYSVLDLYESNAQTAEAAERIQREHGFPARIHVLIQDLDLCAALRARRWSLLHGARRQVDFFNLDELAAYATTRARPLAAAVGAGAAPSSTVVAAPAHCATPTDDAPPEIAIAGSGPFARSVVLETARRWAVRGGRRGPVRVSLLAPDAAEVAKELYGRFAFLEGCCRITPLTEPLAEFLADRRARRPAVRPLQRLYLCQDDESEAFRSALDTATRLQSTFEEVIVRLDRTAGLAGGFQTDARGGALFDALGGRLRLVDVSAVGADPELIGDGLTEQLARACHQHYLISRINAGEAVGSQPALVGWEELADDFRAANRDQAVDLARKLALIGCRLGLRSADVSPFAFRDDELEYLAEFEHERWALERVRAGWVWGPERDNGVKAHPSLVPWQELPEPEREKDREVVLAMAPILADAGLTPVRGART